MSTLQKPLIIITLALALTTGVSYARQHTGVMNAPMALLTEQQLDDLALSQEQNTMHQTIVAFAHESQTGVQQQFKAARQLMDAELEKPNPDLALVSEAFEQARNTILQRVTKGKQMRLALYATMSLEQKQVVKVVLKEKLARFDRFRSFMNNIFG